MTDCVDPAGHAAVQQQQQRVRHVTLPAAGRPAADRRRRNAGHPESGRRRRTNSRELRLLSLERFRLSW